MKRPLTSRMTGMRLSVNERLPPLPEQLWNPPSPESVGQQEFLQSECETDHSSPFNINVKNVWSFTFTPLHASIAWCFIRKSKHLTLKLGLCVRLLSCSAYSSILEMVRVRSSETLGPPPDYTTPRNFIFVCLFPRQQIHIYHFKRISFLFPRRKRKTKSYHVPPNRLFLACFLIFKK